MLLDGEQKNLAVPLDKRDKAVKMLQMFTERRKATVKEVQRLAGYLNFLTKAIVPGRGFLRRMYSKYAGIIQPKLSGGCLKHYHHVNVNLEFRSDCKVWLLFLQGIPAVLRPFIDFEHTTTATEVGFASDTSRNSLLGFGCVFKKHWTFGQWEPGYIDTCQPSIAYLELYALCVGILTWGKHLKNGRFNVWCDNMATCYMVNSNSSSCKNCMYLLRLLTLDNLRHNR